MNRVKIDGTTINYISIEDFIIHKIISGREKDIEDAKTILLKNKKIDEGYVLRWLKEFEKTLNAEFVKVFKRLRREVRG